MRRSIVIALIGLAVLAAPGSATAQPTLAETEEIHWQDLLGTELAQRAAELGSAVAIYEFVRNEYRYAIYHGAVSSSGNTYHAERGNDVDLASLLIAMLRSQGIEARYAVGTVRIPAGDLEAWLGVESFDLAHALLNDIGTPKLVKDPGGGYVDLEHAWVQAFVPWDAYRGLAPAGSVDCSSDPTPCAWVDLDPSFKRLSFPPLLDIHDDLEFDYEAYYNAENPSYSPPAGDTIDRQGKNTLEIWEEQILAHLRDRDQGESLEDVARVGEIVREKAGVLPASLSYEVLSAVEVYSSVAERGPGTSRTWTKMIRLKMYFNGTSETPSATEIDAGTVSVVQASRYRLSIAYEGGVSPQMVTRLANQDPPVAVPVEIGVTTTDEGNPIFAGTLFSLVIERDGNADVRTVEYDGNVVAGYFVIGSGDETSNHARTQQAAETLLAAHESWSIVFGPGGVPHVDVNANGWDAGDPMLWDHPDAMWDLTGGLLDVAASYYMAHVHEARRRFNALNHTVSLVSTELVLVSTVFEVDYVAETPFEVLPLGLLINSSQDGYGPFRVASGSEFSKKTFDLWAHIGSSLEHEVWQEVVGYQAISTASGIQAALKDGANLLDVEVSETVDTMQSSYDVFDFSQTLPPGYTQHTFPMYGRTQWTFTADGSAEDFAMVREDMSIGIGVPGLLPGYYMTPAVASGNHSFVQSFHDAPAVLQNMINTGTVFIQPNDLGGCQAPGFTPSIFPSYLINWVETCYFHTLQNTPLQGSNGEAGYTLFDAFEFLQSENGFGTTGTVYRTEPPPDATKHTWGFVANAHAFLYTIEPGYTNRFVTPDAPTAGPTFRFQVSILQQYAPNDVFGMSFLVENNSDLLANGGFTAGEDPLDPDTDTDAFDNSRFTGDNLIAPVNNDLIVTPSTADPVSVVSGNMYLDETDLVLKSRGMDITFTRTYNSSSVDDDQTGNPLSPGWTHSYLVSLRANDYGVNPNDGDPANSDGETSTISYRDERGGEINYAVSSPAWDPQPQLGTFDDLELDTTPGEHTLTFRNGVKYVFEGPDLRTPGDSARLSRIEDPYGNTLTLSYNGSGQLINVDDGINGGLSFLYAGGNLRVVYDWTLRAVTLNYNASSGNLESVEDPEGHIKTYTYVSGTSQLEDVILPEDRDGDGQGGDVRMHYSYYRNGRAFGNANALGQGESLEYDFHEKRTRVTDPRGFVREYKFDRSGLLTKLREPDGGVKLFAYTDDLIRMSKIDALGYETTYSYQLDRIITSDPSTSFGNVTLEEDPLGQTTEYDYDFVHFDQPIRIEDKNGGVRRFHYYTADGPGARRGKLHYVEMETLGGIANVRLQELTYNSDGTVQQLIEYIEPGNLSRKRTTTYAYSPDGLDVEEIVVAGTDGATRRMTLTYDDLGRVKTETLWRRTSPTDPTLMPTTNRYTYDALDRVIRLEDALGNRVDTEYDGNGQIKERRALYKKPDDTYETRVLEQLVYDNGDRLIESRDPRNGSAVRSEYDEAGNVIRVTDAVGTVVHNEYDSMNRRTAVVDQNGHRMQTVYDAGGRVTAEIDGNGNVTRYEYDALGRKTAEIDPSMHRTEFRYYPDGQVKSIIAANAMADPTLLNSEGATRFYEYDELGRRVRMLDALEGETFFEYDLLGNRTKVVDAEGQETEFVYDDLGRLKEVRDAIHESPIDRVTSIVRDEADNVIQRTDRKGQTVQTTYDVLNRPVLTEFLASGEEEVRTYDLFGNLETLVNDEVGYSFVWDDHDRLRTKTDDRFGRSILFDYDVGGRLVERTTYEGDVTAYQYDGTGRLVGEHNPSHLHVSYHYDPGGRLINRILSNGARTDYRYDASGRVTSITNVSPDSSTVASATYAYDAVGNVDVMTLDGSTIDFDYDAMNRLTEADYPGEVDDRSYTYDLVGNRDTVTNNGTTFDYVYNNSGNRLDEIRLASDGSLVRRFVYDHNGAVVAKEDGTGTVLFSLVRNVRGQIASVGGQVPTANAYGYDSRRLRVRREDSEGSRLYHLDGEELDSIYDEGGSLSARYLRGSVVDEVVNAYVEDGEGELQAYTFHHDIINSVVALSGHAGTTEETTRYGAFGEVLSSTGSTKNEFLYTGRELDSDTGLYYYRARHYDAEIGRFLSEDPMGFAGGDLNLYAYAGNNPLMARDPSGTVVTPDTAADIGFIIYDIWVIADEGLDWGNGLALAADIGGALLPGATGLGALVHSWRAPVSVIGRYPAPMAYLGAHGYDVLNIVPNSKWSWSANVQWMDNAITGGQSFHLTDLPLTQNLFRADGALSTFADEITYVLNQGTHQWGALNRLVPTHTQLLSAANPLPSLAGIGAAHNFVFGDSSLSANSLLGGNVWGGGGLDGIDLLGGIDLGLGPGGLLGGGLTSSLGDSFGGLLGGPISLDYLLPPSWGGFLIYPNVPNFNRSARVYRK